MNHAAKAECVKKAKTKGGGPSRAALPDPALRRAWEGLVAPGGAARADLYLAEVARVLSRSQLKARGAAISVGGKPVKPSRPLKEGEKIRVEWVEEPSPGLESEDIPLALVHEDERCLVIDKAQGMVTHPGAGNRRGTLANAVLGFLGRRRAEAALEGAAPTAAGAPPLRGGIVHRLDKDTSGLIIVAKDAEAQAFLAAQFKDRAARKEYLAITRGIPRPEEGRIEDRLGRDRRDRKRFARVAEGGRVAVTEYRVLASWGSRFKGEGYALVSLRPRTGRTHQLRVHMAGLGTPILGDPIYGSRDARFPEASLMLHAYRLRIQLPGLDEPSSFRAAPPLRFESVIRSLRAAFGHEKLQGSERSRPPRGNSGSSSGSGGSQGPVAGRA
ncbi:MAG: RluA family pseudouridine synthase [Spirochaetaceae bacterium]|nr:RluA family pseudouridine synthase [Spirochaetaceae bacterium]